MRKRLSSALPAATLAIVVLGGLPTPSSAQTAGSGGEAALPTAGALRLQDTTVLPSAAPNAFRGGMECDSHGDAFVQFARLAGAPLHLEPSSSISEVIPDDERIVSYGASPLSESDYPHARVTSFGVLPDGELYALIYTRRDPSKEKPRPEPEYFIERFKDDGSTDSITPLRAPRSVTHWFADLIAPFPEGNFLIAGTSTTTTGQPSANSWRPFTAIYSPSGRFIREVTLPRDITNNFSKHGTGESAAAKAKGHGSQTGASKPQQYFEVAISTGGLVSGPDGNVWILRASDPVRLYGVNSAGQVTQALEFPSPVAGLLPFNFGFAGPEQIFVDFVRAPGSPTAVSGPSELIGVFNTVSQQFDALYVKPEEANKSFRVLACGDGKDGFLYLGGTTDNRLAIFDYTPR